MAQHDPFRVIKDYSYYDYAYFAEIQRKREEEKAEIWRKWRVWQWLILAAIFAVLVIGIYGEVR